MNNDTTALVGRLLARAATLDDMGRKNEALDREHSFSIVTLTRDHLRDAAKALQALDDENNDLQAKLARAERELEIERMPKCFSCGVTVRDDCPRSSAKYCGRIHLGGSFNGLVD